MFARPEAVPPLEGWTYVRSDRRSLSPGEIHAIQGICGRSNVLTDSADLLCCGRDASFLSRQAPCAPDAVVYPPGKDELCELVGYAAQRDIPLVPRGAGTGMAAGALPIRGGIVLDFTRWNRIRRLDLDNLQVEVEPGVVHANLNHTLAHAGFFFPPDPGSSAMCTLGGMVANDTSGMRSVKYGTTRHYVLGLEVVLGDGTIMVTGGQRSRVLKSVAGYDLTRLLVGSEGTLGLITGIRLKVLPLPRRRGIVIGVFHRLRSVGDAVGELLRSGCFPSALEIMDGPAVEAARAHSPAVVLPGGEALLLVEADGGPAAVREMTEEIGGILVSHGAQVQLATDPGECDRLWAARSVVGAAVTRLRPGATRVYAGEDIGVPVARVTDALEGCRTILERHRLQSVIYGHVGDGNLHVAMVADVTCPRELETVMRAEEALHRLALDLEGTVTAEHGVGLVRARYMKEELGSLPLQSMRRIKRALDPGGILNPGKMALEDEMAHV